MNWIQRQLVKLAGMPAPDDNFWYRRDPRFPNDQGGGATSLAIVDACVSLISGSIAQLPLKVFSTDADGNRVEFHEHPVYSVLHDRPSPNYSAYDYWTRTVRDVLTKGNAVSVLTLGGHADVTAMEPLDMRFVEINVDKDSGLKTFKYEPPPDVGARRIYTGEEVIHYPGRDYDGVRGYSPLEAHRRTMDIALNAQEYGAVFFENNATPPQYISFPQGLSADAKARLKDWFKENHGGIRKAHQLGVLEFGGEIKSVGINHRDIQYLELRGYQDIQICQIYLVPPHMVGIVDKTTSWGTGIEQMQIGFVTFTLAPWLKMIEQRLKMSVFGPRENAWAEFVVDGLLRGDSTARGAFYREMISTGMMAPNEGRRKENLPPMPGGDQLYMQGAMMPITKLGETPQTGAPQ